MSISRNEHCECGSGKKYKNCCMIKKNNSNLKKYGYKIIFLIALSFIVTVTYNRFRDSGPNNDYDRWCYECGKWVTGDNPDTDRNESSTGHKTDWCKECNGYVDPIGHAHLGK